MNVNWIEVKMGNLALHENIECVLWWIKRIFQLSHVLLVVFDGHRVVIAFSGFHFIVFYWHFIAFCHLEQWLTEVHWKKPSVWTCESNICLFCFDPSLAFSILELNVWFQLALELSMWIGQWFKCCFRLRGKFDLVMRSC